eukprot:c42019_g1_i1 orf=94-357(+)
MVLGGFSSLPSMVGQLDRYIPVMKLHTAEVLRGFCSPESPVSMGHRMQNSSILHLLNGMICSLHGQKEWAMSLEFQIYVFKSIIQSA